MTLFIREMPDNRSEFREGLATEWTLSEDGTELLFTIRDGVRFHDGSDLTVNDVVFTSVGTLSRRLTQRHSLLSSPSRQLATIR